jgi:hypothetical protein
MRSRDHGPEDELLVNRTRWSHIVKRAFTLLIFFTAPLIVLALCRAALETWILASAVDLPHWNRGHKGRHGIDIVD